VILTAFMFVMAMSAFTGISMAAQAPYYTYCGMHGCALPLHTIAAAMTQQKAAMAQNKAVMPGENTQVTSATTNVSNSNIEKQSAYTILALAAKNSMNEKQVFNSSVKKEPTNTVVMNTQKVSKAGGRTMLNSRGSQYASRKGWRSPEVAVAAADRKIKQEYQVKQEGKQEPMTMTGVIQASTEKTKGFLPKDLTGGALVEAKAGKTPHFQLYCMQASRSGCVQHEY
jgi:hypothetical protein